MHLLSCPHCGIVLNKQFVNFPYKIEDEIGNVLDDARWNGDKYVSFVSCPACNGEILEETYAS